MSDTFSAFALARQSARRCRFTASLFCIASRRPRGAVTRSGFIPVTGAVELLAVGVWAMLADVTGSVTATMIAMKNQAHFIISNSSLLRMLFQKSDRAAALPIASVKGRVGT
jgi:hypothetical protein